MFRLISAILNPLAQHDNNNYKWIWVKKEKIVGQKHIQNYLLKFRIVMVKSG